MSSKPCRARNGAARKRFTRACRAQTLLTMPAPATARLRLLVTVKAYPSVSTKYNELVCCAGITEDRQWVRLYPVPYRDLPNHTQFQKYDIVEVTCDRREAHKDNRPESWCPRLDTMRVT